VLNNLKWSWQCLGVQTRGVCAMMHMCMKLLISQIKTELPGMLLPETTTQHLSAPLVLQNTVADTTKSDADKVLECPLPKSWNIV
jgi:hypothetical protein